jgi:hypothetical protein
MKDIKHRPFQNEFKYVTWLCMNDSRAYSVPYGPERENCELSDRDSRELDINNPSYFETTGDYDFYERFGGRAGGDCLDGKNFTLPFVFAPSSQKYQPIRCLN